MKLATFRPGENSNPHVGIVDAVRNRVFDLTAAAARAGHGQEAFRDMQSLMEAGAPALDAARTLLDKAEKSPNIDFSLDAVKLLSPVPLPQSIRDFVTFPGHILGAPRALQSLRARMANQQAPAAAAAPEMAPVYRNIPNFYKGNRFTTIGSGEEVRRPSDCEYLDYELEFGIYIGRKGANISKARAKDHIFGYTIFNDFSARDTQVREMGGMTGPCKSKDFNTGNAIGPWIVTADEIADPYALTMAARVNGEVWCSGKSDGMIHSFEDMIAYVSRDETLFPGEFFGSGTVGGGTGMEIGRFLQDGDIVELEVSGLGVLRNRIVPATVQ